MDSQTLYEIQAALLMALAAAVALTHRAYDRPVTERGARWFALGYVAAGIGLAIQSQKDSLPPLFGLVIGIGFLFLMPPLMNLAILHVTQRASRETLAAQIAILVLGICAITRFTLVHPDAQSHNIAATVTLAVMASVNLFSLSRPVDPVVQPAVRLTAWLLTFHISMLIMRVVMMLNRQSELWFTLGGVISITGTAVAFIWVDMLRTRHALEQSALTDPLTGLLNRRALDTLAPREIQRATRHGQACSALMMDIDLFKQINDTLGHAAGDASLCAVAGVLKATLREGDLAIRLGGDEFFLLLPNCSANETEVVTARLRLAIDALKIQTRSGTSFGVSVSIGLVAQRGQSLSVEDLLHASDLMLYREKQIRKAMAISEIDPPHSTDDSGGGPHVHPSNA